MKLEISLQAIIPLCHSRVIKWFLSFIDHKIDLRLFHHWYYHHYLHTMTQSAASLTSSENFRKANINTNPLKHIHPHTHTHTFCFFFNPFLHQMLIEAIFWLEFTGVKVFFFFFIKKISVLFAQGQLLQALRPHDFQKGWGLASHPVSQALPAPSCFLQELEEWIKCTIRYLFNFVCVSVAQSYPTLRPHGL